MAEEQGSNQNGGDGGSRGAQAPSPGAEAIAGVRISKRFGHVRALIDANIAVRRGEVVALFGDNGAGKSTLLNCLLGIYRPDSGTVRIDGSEVRLTSIRDAQMRGVDCIFQDLSLAPDLSVIDNVFLGHEQLHPAPLRWFGALARSSMEERADAALRQLGISLNSLRIPVRSLSGGQRQAVAIARAIMWSRSAILMDEPTAALGARQSAIVCELIRAVAASGLAVLVVSHDIPRILAVADRVVILWRGETAVEAPAPSLTVGDVVSTMVGFKPRSAA